MVGEMANDGGSKLLPSTGRVAFSSQSYKSENDFIFS